MGKGVIIGLSNLYYAFLIDDPITGTATYGTPKKLVGAINAKINPNASTETLFADDGPYETAATIGKIELELNVADLTLDVQADLLGHQKVGGVLIRKASDIPPWVAIGFQSLKSNGHYRFTWLGKGKFSASEQANETKGDSVNFQTPTINGSFVKRDCDGEWERHADEDDEDYMAAIGTNWFNSPYGGAPDTTAPTISSIVPAEDATGIAINTTIVWTFSEALALSTVTTDHFMLINSGSNSVVAGVLSINAARTTVTFTPSANLSNNNTYETVVTPGVTDIYGNKITASVTVFTTVA
jgi:phi13 family phage major tail protein